MTAAGISLGELAAAVGAELRGEPDHCVQGMNTLAAAAPHELAFLANPKYRSQLAATQAGAVLLRHDDLGDFTGNALLLANPYLAFATLSHRFDRTPQPAAGVHNSAVVAESAVLGEGVSIGAQVVIGDGVVIGAGSLIEAGSVIHDRVVLGENCRIRSRVVIYHDCRLGNRVQVHSGAVIGGDGFGFANERGQWRKIAQLGAVVIGDDVDIGANTTIDRGALEDTEIHTGAIIDNQVQIAHNVIIGAHTAIAACCGISGSTQIGAHCILAGGVGVVGHIQICDGVQITGMTMVTKSITEPGSYSSGTAFDRTDAWKKMAVRLRRLDDLATRVQRLEKNRD
ncbi:UDP-3-O-[3-hydroxymyristoyl] glucosamine N-acyltransferase [Paraperlucidibaca baekdonensis]|uniref:UDP-3-O-acylglucosamine N-acyltransferase n=1 Tax=Paraperlucidibaca baekdonensis TaxID=748120 RepID=A0A3E0H3K9_9GAMM|nr:UDP-3-O-(3-hydroxymyristoyl)glucosamine N-acyltransferase [Paraperlucidibaca baekdonensis]REH37897.1 UDP-3-O-[3-hydroxymyristoyl] glucosamine N-acyltransferase [Paraperlucidibaca baekdonensis]